MHARCFDHVVVIRQKGLTDVVSLDSFAAVSFGIQATGCCAGSACNEGPNIRSDSLSSQCLADV